MAAEAAPPPSALSPLPLSLVHHIFSLLPPDVRARCACVCRGWHTTLLEPSLWTRLNLSPSSGVRVRVADAVLAGAAAKARGQLTALNILGCEAVSFDALLAVVRANGDALRELCVGVHTLQTLNVDRVMQLLQAAPQLTACHADVRAVTGIDVADARRMLRNETPFQPLRLHTLSVAFPDDADDASAIVLAADLAAHASLHRVELSNAPLATLAALDAFVDAALMRRMSSFFFVNCRFSPASAPALARLVGGGALKTLFISQSGEQLLDGPSAALLAAALRANTTLTSLSFVSMRLWSDTDAAAALLSALTGHPSVRTLILAVNRVDAAHEAAAGAALGALVAANAPALTELNASSSNLGDAVLRPLIEALPANAHLRELDISYNGMSEAFARDVLLPAVRANTSLRTLRVDIEIPGAVAAMALVAARRDGGGGGAA
jgi:hypothetical protein